MHRPIDYRATLILLLAIFFSFLSKAAGTLDVIGVNLLRQVDGTLRGNGVILAQAEAPLTTNSPPPFEVNPTTVGQTLNLFTYISGSGSANAFPNSVGAESGHANGVALNLYGSSSGVATQLGHVDNYDANYFYNNVIGALLPPTITDSLVNQSYVFLNISPTLQSQVEQDFDNYAAAHNILFISGAGDGGAVLAPASCFNGIGVGAYGGASSVGPTGDNRSKPDLTAPSDVTSFSTPWVSGCAAVLLQAAKRGDGGSSVSAATDLRTLKALLFNGAVKPADWANTTSRPFDPRYGAGIVNIFNSWEELRGGQQSFIEATSNTAGSPHPPGASPNNVPTLTGWDFNSISNPRSGLAYKEAVNHYYFNLNPTNAVPFTLTATLVWNRQSGQTTANDLNLFLYNASDGRLVNASTSPVDNVEHIFVTDLPAGRYDLQVEKNPANLISANETYALAFEFSNLSLDITRTNSSLAISWPVSPAGFRLESASSLTPPASWSPVSDTAVVVNNRNLVLLPPSALAQFFRLQRP